MKGGAGGGNGGRRPVHDRERGTIANGDGRSATINISGEPGLSFFFILGPDGFEWLVR